MSEMNQDDQQENNSATENTDSLDSLETGETEKESGVNIHDNVESIFDRLSGENKPDQEEEEDSGDEEDVAEDVEQEVSEESEGEGGITAPDHWTDEQKELWSRIQDPAAQELVKTMDKKLWEKHTERSQELAEQRRGVEDLQNLMSPYKDILKASGFTPAQYMAQYVEWDRKLASNPAAAISELAQKFNVPIYVEEADHEYDDDPRFAALQKEITALKQNQQHRDQLTYQYQHEQAAAEIQSFANAKGDDGSLKYPHFETLKTKMGTLLSGGVANTLAEAYAMAEMVDPDLSAQQIDKKVQNKLKETMKNQDLKKAKKATKRLSGSGPSKTAPTQHSTIRDSVAAAFERISSTS